MFQSKHQHGMYLLRQRILNCCCDNTLTPTSCGPVVSLLTTGQWVFSFFISSGTLAPFTSSTFTCFYKWTTLTTNNTDSTTYSTDNTIYNTDHWTLTTLTTDNTIYNSDHIYNAAWHDMTWHTFSLITDENITK